MGGGGLMSVWWVSAQADYLGGALDDVETDLIVISLLPGTLPPFPRPHSTNSHNTTRLPGVHARCTS